MYLYPPFQGFRLVKGKYVPIKEAAGGGLTSREIGLCFVQDGGYLRIIDLDTGERVLSAHEIAEKADQLRQQAELMRELLELTNQRYDVVLQRLASLEAEIERLRAQLGQH
jgi:hypothetical protein